MNKKSLQLFIFLLLFCLPTEIQPAAQSPWDFSLLDADGQRHTADEWKGARAVVLLFLATECPISNRYAPDLKRLVADYGYQGVAFYGVHSDPDIGPAAVGQHAREYGLSFPMLMDTTQVLASRTGVTLTPTAVILSSAGELLYRGRIDNRNLDYSRYRNSGIKADLRLALEATLAGRTIAEPITKPIGCALPPPERDSPEKSQKLKNNF